MGCRSACVLGVKLNYRFANGACSALIAFLAACSNGANQNGAANGSGGMTNTATSPSGGATTRSGDSSQGGGAYSLGGDSSRSGGVNSLGGARDPQSGGATSADTRNSTLGGTTSGEGGAQAPRGGTTSGSSGTQSGIGGSSVRGGAGGTSNGGSAQPAAGRSSGSSSGGRATGGTMTGGSPSGGNVGSNTAASAGQSSFAPAAITKDNEGALALSGLTIISYGGYLNGESFQQDGIVTFNGYQYSAFWNTNRHVVLARRKLPNASWEKFEFTDYTNSADDAHNTISLGIGAGDGTLHLSFDHHTSDLHYRKSVAGFLTNPADSAWAASSFSAVTSSLVGTTAVTKVTYPRFVTEPGGSKLLFSARIGESGSGDEYLWEYDTTSHTWTSIGKYIDGITDSINAYLHGLAYTRGGSRLHAAWCWRETSDASTNHDLLYVYSDDNGRTWKTNSGSAAGTSGSAAIRANTAGIKVYGINQNRGLINQEHLAVDGSGRVHVLLSHMPDGEADNTNFDNARARSQFFHYWRDPAGTWTRTSIGGLPVVANFRGKLAISSTDNVYAILPDLRIAGASPGNKYGSWSLLDSSDSGRFFSDPLIDTARLALEDKLTVYYPEKSSVNIDALDYTLK